MVFPQPKRTRIYDIIRQYAHSDGRVDIENLSSFINAYRTVTNLKLGEFMGDSLLMLRLALIENSQNVIRAGSLFIEYDS